MWRTGTLSSYRGEYSWACPTLQRLHVMFDMTEPDPDTTLRDAVRQALDPVDRRVLRARGAGRAWLLLLEGPHDVWASLIFSQWPNGGWTIDGYSECKTGPRRVYRMN